MKTNPTTPRTSAGKTLLTQDQVAELLQVRGRWVYDAVVKGRLPAG